MGYSFDPKVFASTVAIPRFVAENHLKLATDLQLRVLICAYRDISEPISPEKIAAALSADVKEVEDCLIYWSQNGAFISDGVDEQVGQAVKAPVIKKEALPTRNDVAARGLSDPKVAMLLREAQLKFGRNLKTNESAVLVWMYDDLGLSVSVILMLLQYAISENKCNITFIQKTAVAWENAGVQTVVDAESIIAKCVIDKLAFERVRRIFGLDKRNPSERELELCTLWTDKWKLSDDLLKLAYDACVDSKSKFSFAYTAKIIESWHALGCKTAADVKALKSDKKEGKADKSKRGFAAYDIDSFEKMLESD